ncbi:MAG: enoyl-CoA hydratase-related protein [Candidatus Dormibacteria bacterium]
MNTEVAAPPVLEERADRILTLTLNRPHRLNAVTPQLLTALTTALRAAESDDGVRAVLITGAGRAFCSGLDLRAASEDGASSVDVRRALREYYGPAIKTMRALPKPVIAAVNGPAAGAGFSLALAADLRIASESATFVQAFVRIGLVPDAGSTYFLPRLVGPARAAELMMLGETVDARRAQDIGLVSRVVPDNELLATALGIATQLANGPRSLAFIKEALALSSSNDLEGQLEVEERLQEAAVGTSDFYEGIGAFLEKRAPRFSGT